MKYLSRDDLEENIAVIKINQSYNDELSALQLYDITRGCWKRKLESVQKVEYVLAVSFGIVKEVYVVDKWVPAVELHRETIPFEAERESGRVGFFGQVAPNDIRNKYIESSVVNLFQRGESSPIKTFFKDNVSNTQKEWEKKAKALSSEIDELHLQGMDEEAIVKVRVNQGVFRERLLKKYSRCCLCNVNNKDLLIASHIKPWKDSAEEERLDMDNGFLLCPNHDKLFDNGFISFDNMGQIIISEKLNQVNRVFMNVNNDIKIDINDGNRKYLEYHRDYILQKEN